MVSACARWFWPDVSLDSAQQYFWQAFTWRKQYRELCCWAKISSGNHSSSSGHSTLCVQQVLPFLCLDSSCIKRRFTLLLSSVVWCHISPSLSGATSHLHCPNCLFPITPYRAEHGKLHTVLLSFTCWFARIFGSFCHKTPVSVCMF